MHCSEIKFTLVRNVRLRSNFTVTKNDHRVWKVYFCCKAFLRKGLEDTSDGHGWVFWHIRLLRAFSFVSAAYSGISPIQNPNQFSSGDRKDDTFRSFRTFSRTQYKHIRIRTYICISMCFDLEFVLHRVSHHCIYSYQNTSTNNSLVINN